MPAFIGDFEARIKKTRKMREVHASIKGLPPPILGRYGVKIGSGLAELGSTESRPPCAQESWAVQLEVERGLRRAQVPRRSDRLPSRCQQFRAQPGARSSNRIITHPRAAQGGAEADGKQTQAIARSSESRTSLSPCQRERAAISDRPQTNKTNNKQ